MLKGLFTPSIPYWPLLESGDSSPYFGTFEGQRYGFWDTDDCWDFSACELAETRLEMLWKMNLIPDDTKQWLIQNKYLDSDGDFYLSRRWEAILSGVTSNGNNQLNFWKDIGGTMFKQGYGLIPNWMLPFSVNETNQFVTRSQFDSEYYNPNIITDAMRQMGQEFLKRFFLQAENIPGGYIQDISNSLITYLKEGSMQIGIPVPQDGSWNQVKVDYPKGRTNADHAVELYKFSPETDPKYPFFIYDSYEPHLKQLSADYFIPFITRVRIKPIQVVQPVPLPQFSNWMKFWFNVKAWLQGSTLPYPEVTIGKAV